MTAQDIIEAAFIELGILVSGGSLSTDDLTWALGKLNRFLNTLSSDGLNLHYREHESFPLISGTASYTIGSGADFDAVRPLAIEQAWIRDNDHDYSLNIRPAAEYWDLSEKTTEGRPIKLYYGFTYPDGTIYLYFTPDSAYTMHTVSQKPLIIYASANTEASLPGEYGDALVLNLAIRIASRYGKAVSAQLRLDAKEALGNMRALNLSGQMKGVDLDLSGTRRGTYNIDSDC